jgi:two-component system response regulator MprA
MRVLVVEDHKELAATIAVGLRRAGMAVDIVFDGQDGLDHAASDCYDVIVLDRDLPRVHGDDVCRTLVADGSRSRVLMLTAAGTLEHRVDGLGLGADDYLAKPFALEELFARLRALLRRTGSAADDGELSFAELRLDSARHGVVVADDAFVELTRTEYRLLELLMRNPRQVLPHTLIYERVWEYDFGPTSNALRVYVGYLRRKLQEAGSRDLIHTVRGVGYGLREQ